jgi:hypothetical protein
VIVTEVMGSPYFSNAILSLNTGKREANMSLKQIAQVGYYNSNITRIVSKY